MRLKLYVGVLSFLFTLSTLAQEGFNGGMKVALAGSQIDGDDYSGYNKLNVQAGFWVDYTLTDKISLRSEIGYAEKGAVEREKFMNGDQETSIIVFKARFYYSEIPLLLYYKTPSRFTLVGGMAMGYLFGSYVYEADLTNGGYSEFKNSALYNQWDYSGILGIGYPIFEKLSLDVRFQYSLTAFKKEAVANPNLRFQYRAGYEHNIISFGLSYTF